MSAICNNESGVHATKYKSNQKILKTYDVGNWTTERPVPAIRTKNMYEISFYGKYGILTHRHIGWISVNRTLLSVFKNG